MRIALLANSQGTDLGVRPGSEYPQLVKRALEPEHAVEVRAVSGATVRDFNRVLPEVLARGAALVVLQVGIVECSRRILSTREKAVLARIPGSRRLTRALHDHRQVVVRARHRLGIDTRLFSAGEFAREAEAFARTAAAAGARPIFVEIPAFGPDHERRWFPLSGEDAGRFNAAIAAHETIPLLSPADAAADVWQPGTVHLTEHGHELAARALVEQLRALLPVAA